MFIFPWLCSQCTSTGKRWIRQCLRKCESRKLRERSLQNFDWWGCSEIQKDHEDSERILPRFAYRGKPYVEHELWWYSPHQGLWYGRQKNQGWVPETGRSTVRHRKVTIDAMNWTATRICTRSFRCIFSSTGAIYYYLLKYFAGNSCYLVFPRILSFHVLEILLKSEEVRQPRSRYTAGRKKGVEIHGRREGRVRRTQVLSWSIQYP